MAYFWANRSVDFMNVIYSTAVDTSYFDYDGYGNAQGVLWTYANGMQMAVDGHGIDAYGITGTIDYCWVWDSVYDSVEAYGISGGNLPVSTAINAVLAGNLWPTVFAGSDTFSAATRPTACWAMEATTLWPAMAATTNCTAAMAATW